MNYSWASLRILHIVCGTIWVGGDFIFTTIIFPRLRALGPDVERPVLGELARYAPRVMIPCSLVTVVTGVWMVGSMQGWNVSWMFASGWGSAIAIGLIGTAAAVFVGLALIPPVTIRYEKLMRATSGRKPTADEAQELARLGTRAIWLARINTVLLLMVAGAMALARVA
jgi:hypothetical protein